MNGTRYLIDTNFFIDYFKNEPYAVSFFAEIMDCVLLTSVINRMELLCSGGITEDEEVRTLDLLKIFRIVPLCREVEQKAVAIRRATGRKLPDAIVAASALHADAILITSDKPLATTSFPGLRAVNPMIR